jgi:Spy/CpxP family protein refolding chaperone
MLALGTLCIIFLEKIQHGFISLCRLFAGVQLSLIQILQVLNAVFLHQIDTRYCPIFFKSDGKNIMKKSNLIISSVLAASMLTIGSAGIVHAYGGPGGGPEYCEHHRSVHRAEHDDRMTFMMNQLDLDRQQRDAISKIKDEQAKKTEARMDEMMKIRNAMREQARAEKYDAAKVRELADAQAKLMADMMVERVETMNRIREQLTKDQAARMEQMKARMMERRSLNDVR